MPGGILGGPVDGGFALSLFAASGTVSLGNVGAYADAVGRESAGEEDMAVA